MNASGSVPFAPPLLFLPLAVLLTACGRPPPPPPPHVAQVFHLNAYEKDFGYSQAVLIDKTLYVSATLPVDASGRLVAPGDMAGQVRAVYANLQRTLAAHQLDFGNVVRETVHTTDLDRFLKASDVRLQYYDKERLPAISWVEVRRLVDPQFLVEIEVVAELP